VGSDPEPFEAWAEATAAGLDSLWDDEQALYVDYDVIAEKRVGVGTAAGLAPLYAGVPARSRAARMVERLAGSRVQVGSSGWAVTSLSPSDPGFQPTRYWRGPVWPILNWVLGRGLERYGYSDEAEQVRRAVVELGRSEGFWEHYDPLTGRGHGGEQFAWTAGLVLDLLTDGGPTATRRERGH
jgi:neutral trehalase